MAHTSIIVSNLDKAHFVALHTCRVPLASQIKNTLTDARLYGHAQGHAVVSHWSELPFLNRIIAIFHSEADASCACEYLRQAQRVPAGATAFVLPETARISQQENLLQRLSLAGELTQQPVPPSAAAAGLAAYHEPEPKPIDMYADLLRAGIDISKFNTDEQVDEVRGAPGHQDAPGVARSRSPTKTLFKPPLRLNTQAACAEGASPASPTITLDQI
ncbi:hypothetical protein METBIDRAFT_9345 [Metschnikowia bicuspidata var. bicuspidata NRRL YB-4993]|uniref:Uncharacterized protein n=1 Tax=Metschnikowia bicuspidata var. bicuspidata NRRL YB-4993 TaxID=869754 RepID=A0A1A0HGA4_9ASCO|nr:hypothetical protein METBIDRAFT_9345 [Metschnikowia bicuspidata var. bicuspidata NRRL YB-4993]OBA23020.1 hypothetical protein METBIDRAFT_9345 [Metschnikowia bicuspidata var. bicuspidata NRRL YB-4993]